MDNFYYDNLTISSIIVNWQGRSIFDVFTYKEREREERDPFQLGVKALQIWKSFLLIISIIFFVIEFFPQIQNILL